MENPKNSQPKSGNHTSVPPVPFVPPVPSVPRFPATATSPSPLEGGEREGADVYYIYGNLRSIHGNLRKKTGAASLSP